MPSVLLWPQTPQLTSVDQQRRQGYVNSFGRESLWIGSLISDGSIPLFSSSRRTVDAFVSVGTIFLAHRSSGSALDHRSLPPVFESRRGHIWRLFRLSLRLITFGGRSAHLAYLVHKSGRKTSIIIIHRTRQIAVSVVYTINILPLLLLLL